MRTTCHLDDYGTEGFLDVAANFGSGDYGYVVTPNADHLIRFHDDASFRELYAGAAYVLLDSRFLSHILRLTRKMKLKVCPGSDLVASLLQTLVHPDDGLVVVGGSDEQAAEITARYGLRRIAHYNPPMGFIHDPAEVEACLKFIESHSPFRFCLLAIGSPQQEIIARMLKTRGIARGMSLCVGASLNFLTGQERRAPRWMQQLGLEWAFRLSQAPGRMGKRYLIRGPRVFGLLKSMDLILRPAAMAKSPRIPGMPVIAANNGWHVAPVKTAIAATAA